MAAKGNKNASKYSEDIVIEICDLVASGLNIKTALKSKKHYPDFSTWCRWKRSNNFVCNLYVNAIQDKAEDSDYRIDQTIEELRAGDIEPSAANVIIQTHKWKASKYYPKMFGDKAELDITSKGESISLTPMQFVKANAKD